MDSILTGAKKRLYAAVHVLKRLVSGFGWQRLIYYVGTSCYLLVVMVAVEVILWSDAGTTSGLGYS